MGQHLFEDQYTVLLCGNPYYYYTKFHAGIWGSYDAYTIQCNRNGRKDGHCVFAGAGTGILGNHLGRAYCMVLYADPASDQSMEQSGAQWKKRKRDAESLRADLYKK